MFSLIFILALLSASASAQDTFLTPVDFGLTLSARNQIDYQNLPLNVVVGNFNSDGYPDIARFEGNKLEIFIVLPKGYPSEPQGIRLFDQLIKSIRLDGYRWINENNLAVVLEDGSEEIFYHRGGCLDLSGGKKTFKREDLPRQVSETDFEIVWTSDPRPYGMDRCAVGDLDNDGIIELVTWWKEEYLADSAFFMIYKSTGDNQYELYMEEPFFTDMIDQPHLTSILITDLDQNGQKEIIYTQDKVYLWEFSNPGTYAFWHTSIWFSRAVNDAKISDADQDGIPELAFVTSNAGYQPPTMYVVEEFSHKASWPNYQYVFSTITNFWQDWIDGRLAVGDFDNDGAVDIVSGNFAMVWSYDPVPIQYFRYDSTNAYNFTQEWLETGLWLSCATPVIDDFDSDGENELFAGGVGPGFSSGFIWEATGFGAGYPVWIDTTTWSSNPTLSISGMVDGVCCVLSVCYYTTTQIDTYMYLFGLQNSQYACLWEPAMLDSAACKSPHFFDMDQDGKMNIIMGVRIFDYATPNKVYDWEQTSTGIWIEPDPCTPRQFQLHPNFPNPFNAITVIPYSIAQKSNVAIKIYDICGREVYTLEQPDVLPGNYNHTWDASDLSSGIYIITLKANAYRQVRKAVLVK